MIAVTTSQNNHIYPLHHKNDNDHSVVLSDIYGTPYDNITRALADEPIYRSPVADSPVNCHHRLHTHINSLNNSSASLAKISSGYTNLTYSDSGILADFTELPPKPLTMLIAVPFEITDSLVCYAQTAAHYVKDMSSTNSTLLYHSPHRGYLVVKNFGDDAVIYPADRMYQEMDAAMEVYIAQLGKKLQVNVPNSWLLPGADVEYTTVVSEYIPHQVTTYPHLHQGFEVLSNNHSFIKNYRDSKLPIFHYLINHPYVEIDSTTYANMIVADDGALFSIDHEGCLKSGRKTPDFTAEQINYFFPDTASFERFKQLNLADEVNSAFNGVVQRYGKKISSLTALNIADFEFRKNHLIRQYEQFHTPR